MKFHDYRTGWQILVKSGLAKQMGWKDDGDAAKWLLNRGKFSDPIAYRHTVFTLEWINLGRPYYDIYPSILDMLSKISLHFAGHQIPHPGGLTNLLLRLPENRQHCLTEDGVCVKTLFVSFQPVVREKGSEELESGLVVGIDFGEKDGEGMPVFTLKIFPIDDRNVEDTISMLTDHYSFSVGERISDELIKKCIKVCVAVCMLQDDSEILQPQVLNKDEQRLTNENKEKLVNRARRRGKYGFSVGKNVEVIPHIRRPHPALVWTGHGRTTPKIIFRRGSIVHKSVVEKIPTGKNNDKTT